jgi:hypothetical protein
VPVLLRHYLGPVAKLGPKILLQTAAAAAEDKPMDLIQCSTSVHAFLMILCHASTEHTSNSKHAHAAVPREPGTTAPRQESGRWTFFGKRTPPSMLGQTSAQVATALFRVGRVQPSSLLPFLRWGLALCSAACCVWMGWSRPASWFQ